ncbi:splicing factor 3A subunit 2 [Morus notabilis]|uniref:splicing factor 3A subunit 2 n=1 Tax=Morus notabilis TaxID=981085 RepID=UPI000CED46ED|nr:splicing factor 3A subunit 2 [Morus notabilis]
MAFQAHSGGAASVQNEAIDRRERLQRLARETIDLAKYPYFMRNHLECYECKLCWTLNNKERNYVAQTQGKRHQTNLAKRAAREAKEAPAQPQPHKHKVHIRKIVYTFEAGMSNQERAFRYIYTVAMMFNLCIMA